MARDCKKKAGRRVAYLQPKNLGFFLGCKGNFDALIWIEFLLGHSIMGSSVLHYDYDDVVYCI